MSDTTHAPSPVPSADDFARLLDEVAALRRQVARAETPDVPASPVVAAPAVPSGPAQAPAASAAAPPVTPHGDDRAEAARVEAAPVAPARVGGPAQAGPARPEPALPHGPAAASTVWSAPSLRAGGSPAPARRPAVQNPAVQNPAVQDGDRFNMGPAALLGAPPGPGATGPKAEAAQDTLRAARVAPAPAADGHAPDVALDAAPGALPDLPAWPGQRLVVPPPPPPPEPLALVTWWRTTGRAWLTPERALAVAGSLLTVTGLAFVLVLGARYGWFGPVPRTIALAVVTAGLAVASARVRHSSPTGSSALAATSVSGAYLLVATVSVVYGWVPFAAGPVLATFVAAGGYALASRRRDPWLAVLTLVGLAVAVPVVMVDATRPQGGVRLAAMLVAVGAAALVPVAQRHDWRLAGRIAGAVTLGAQVAVTAVMFDGAGAAAWVPALVVGVVAVTVALLTRELWALIGALVLLAAVTAALSGTLDALVPAVLAAAVWVVAGRLKDERDARSVAALSIAGLVFVAEAVFLAAGSHLLSPACATAALVLVVLSGRLSGRRRVWAAVGAWACALPPALMLCGAAPSYVVVGYGVPSVPLLVTSVLLVAGAIADLAVGADVPGVPRRRRRAVGLALALFASSAAIVGAALLLLPGADGFRAGHVVTTGLWIVVAATLLLRFPGLRIFGFVLCAAALAKLFCFDLVALDGIYRAGAAMFGPADPEADVEFALSGRAGREPVASRSGGRPTTGR